MRRNESSKYVGAGNSPTTQLPRVPQMAVNALRIGRLQYIDGQICHAMVQYGDLTVHYSRIGDRYF